MNAHSTGGLHAADERSRHPSSWRICAVVVSFHPDDGFCERARNIAAQVDGVVIVDNGSSAEALTRLDGLAAGGVAQLIVNATNLGVATALNQGIHYARTHGYTHTLLFDHDTEPVPHMVTTLKRVASQLDDLDRVAALGINFFDAATLQPWYRLDAGDTDAVEIKSMVSSGTLIPLRVVEQVGAFREDFFIDHLEDEYCLRARSRGYKVMLVREPLAVHAVGTPKIYRLPWRTIGTSNHAPTRWYYIVRNHVLLVRGHVRQDPQWVLQSLSTRFKSIVLAVLLDDDRWLKLRLMWQGLLDGLAGRTGQLRTGRPERRT